jgi:hypothetical protein
MLYHNNLVIVIVHLSVLLSSSQSYCSILLHDLTARSYCTMKISKLRQVLRKIDTVAPAATSTNTSTDAPDNHCGICGIEAGIDEFLGKFSGETASARPPSSLAPTGERVSNGDDLHCKPNSTSGQEGAFTETLYARPYSIASF